jgi:hypothetical protein
MSLRAKACSSFSLVLVVALGLTSAANASCDDRPGTPDDVVARPWTTTSLSFGWRARTHDDEMYYDINIRDGQLRDIGRDLTGWGPRTGRFGYGVNQVFEGFQPGTRYCFRIKARTEAGTEGCVSEVWSAWACAATPAWAAVAANPKGFWGYALKRADEATARRDAVNGCGAGAPGCTLVNSGQASCLAYAESHDGGFWYGVGFGESIDFAKDVAMKGCGGGGAPGCHIVGAFCQQ